MLYVYVHVYVYICNYAHINICVVHIITLCVFVSCLHVHVCVQVTLDAGHGVEVPVIFKPSSLGLGEHTAHVSFTSQEVSRIHSVLNITT